MFRKVGIPVSDESVVTSLLKFRPDPGRRAQHVTLCLLDLQHTA